MDKLFIRLTVILTTIYFIVAFVNAWSGEEWFSDAYIVCFEVSLCIVMSFQGRYHCRYMKYTAFGVVSADTVTRIDYAYDWLPVDTATLLPVTLLVSGVVVSFIMALRHYYQVKQLKRKRNDIQRKGTTENRQITVGA